MIVCESRFEPAFTVSSVQSLDHGARDCSNNLRRFWLSHSRGNDECAFFPARTWRVLPALSQASSPTPDIALPDPGYCWKYASRADWYAAALRWDTGGTMIVMATISSACRSCRSYSLEPVFVLAPLELFLRYPGIYAPASRRPVAAATWLAVRSSQGLGKRCNPPVSHRRWRPARAGYGSATRAASSQDKRERTSPRQVPQ